MAVPVYTLKLSVALTSSSVANPTVLTFASNHGFTSGQTITISGHTGSTPAISGNYTFTKTGANTGTIPVNVTVGGTGGSATANRTVRIETFDVTATEGQADVARFQIISPDAAFRVAKGSEVYAYEDADCMFSGLVILVREKGLGGRGGGGAIVNEVECVSFKRYADYRYVTESYASQSLEATLNDLVTYLSAFGVSMHASQATGPTLDALDFQNLQLSAIFNELADLSGYTWNIDENKKLRFTEPNTTAAPYNATDALGNVLDTRDVVVEQSEKDYANRIIVKFGTAGPILDVSETFTGDGSEDEWALAYPLQFPRGEITVNSVLETLVLGYEGTPVGGWDFRPSLNSIRRSAAVTNTHPIVINYNGGFPAQAIAEDTGQQAIRGIIERVVTYPDVWDIVTAQALADAELVKALAQARTVRYSTLSTGIIKPGQTQTITLAKRNLNATFTVTEVRTSNHIGNSVSRDVTAVEGLITIAPIYRRVVRNWNLAGSGGTAGGSSTSSGSTAPVTTIVNGAATVPGGQNKYVQYNDSGAFGGDSRLQWDKTLKRLRLSGDAASQVYSQLVLVSDDDAGRSSLTNWSDDYAELVLGAEYDNAAGGYVPSNTSVGVLLWDSTLGFGLYQFTGLTPVTADALASSNTKLVFDPSNDGRAVLSTKAATGAKPGSVLVLERNTAGNGAPGCLAFESKNGTKYYVWFTDAGVMRFGTAPPEEDGNPAEGSGTAV